jgi:hypothetical protein
MEFMPLIIITIILYLLITGGLHYFSPKQKGIRGEKYVSKRLIAKLPPEYTILNNLYLPLPDKTTTQIDHVVVSPYGIFVIETKNYSGWIFADTNSKYWTQVLFQSKHRFQNPLRQNYRHICALAYNLRLHKQYFHNIVAFDGTCEFKTPLPEGVTYYINIAPYILQFKNPCFTPKQVDQIIDAIEAWQSTVSEEDKKAHIYHLHLRHAGVSKNAPPPPCPYCGGEMTLRHRKDGTGSFYGCTHYPKCRGTINIR